MTAPIVVGQKFMYGLGIRLFVENVVTNNKGTNA